MSGDIDDFGAGKRPFKPLLESDAAASVAGTKICCVCGADVTGKKRMRDAEGRYWCFECGTKDNMRKHPVPCDECGEKFPEFELSGMDGALLCARCANERRLRAKREAARIAAAQQAEREAAERRRKLRLLAMAGAGLLVLYGIVQLIVWLLLRT
jgi:hypothetical protein